MSDDNAPERDSAGRFVRAETPAAPAAGDDTNMHPAAGLIFGWVSNPRTPGILLFVVLALSAVLIAIDLTLARTEPFGFANATGFYGFFGFAAVVLAVLASWLVGAILRRGGDYYGEGDTTPADLDENVEEGR